MNKISAILHRFVQYQGNLVLNRLPYAYALVVLFTGVPLMTWLAVSIVALLTLRKGATYGLTALLAGVLTLSMVLFISSALNVSNLCMVLLTFFPCFFAAWALRITEDWHWVAGGLLLVASLLISILYFISPAFLGEEYQALQLLIQDWQSQGIQLSYWLQEPQTAIAYLLGIHALSFLLSTTISLIVARALQASLFYPNGLRKELLAFQASSLALLPFACIVFGVYEHHPLALSLLPSWLLYLAAAGFSTLLALLATQRVIATFLLLLLATALLPRVLLPIVIGVGLLDSFIHFRTRRLQRTGKKDLTKGE